MTNGSIAKLLSKAVQPALSRRRLGLRHGLGEVL
jgi:hypothetical protein